MNRNRSLLRCCWLLLWLLAACSSNQQLQQEAAENTAMPTTLDAVHQPEITATPLYTTPEYGTAEPGFGQRQSPLNLLTQTDHSQPHDIYIESSDEHVINRINDTGHSIQISFSQPEHIHFDGSEYVLQQCHFHTPSEHQIDGMTYPMEMHCVSVASYSPQNSIPNYLVVAYLFRMGASNAGMAAISKQANAMRAQGERQTDVSKQTLTLEQIIGSADAFTHYFSYAGSLTTAPYSETVRWLVLTRVLNASPEEIQVMNLLDGNNARHIQAANKRLIELD